MQIREPSEADLDALIAFFERVPESERTFFKEPVLDRPTVEGWLTAERGRRGLAFSDDGQVVGYVAVGLAPHLADPAAGIVDLHMYTFNAVDTFEAWRRAYRAKLGAAVAAA